MLSVERAVAAVAEITYGNLEFSVIQDCWLGLMLRITAELPDNMSPGAGIGIGITSRIPPSALHSVPALLEFAAWRVCEMEIHEAREKFRYQGRTVFDPHAE